MSKKYIARAARGALLAGFMVALSSSTFALGLGSATGNPVLGRPLRVEIELLGSDRETAAPHCFKIGRPQNPIDDHYALRGAQLAIERTEGRTYLIVSHAGIQNPVVEFTVQAICGGANLARDYVLLASPEVITKPVVSPPPPMVAAPALATPSAATKPVPSSTAAARPAIAEGATTLEQLARRQYPNQPKAREKYKRMMRTANAALFPPEADTDHHPIPAEATLIVPTGLPERRHGPYLPSAPAKKTPSATQPTLTSATVAPPPPPGSGGGDQLKIGAPAPTTSAEAEADLTRIENLHSELNQTQEQIANKLALAEAAFVELKNHLLRMENRIRELEAERVQEAERRKTADMVQLVLAVLIGGVAGAALLHFVPRHLARRRRTIDDVVDTAPVPVRAAAGHPGMVSAFAALHKASTDVTAEPISTSPPTVQLPPADEESPPAAAEPGKPPQATGTAPLFDFDFVSWVSDEEKSGAKPPPDNK